MSTTEELTEATLSKDGTAPVNIQGKTHEFTATTEAGCRARLLKHRRVRPVFAEGGVVAGFDQVSHVGMPEAMQAQLPGQPDGIPCRRKRVSKEPKDMRAPRSLGHRAEDRSAVWNCCRMPPGIQALS